MPSLTIVSLSTPMTISKTTLDCCKNANKLFVQTAHTPCVRPLLDAGLSFSTMDAHYEAAEDFDALSAAIRRTLLSAAQKEDVTYAVPGRGMGAALLPLIDEAKEAGIVLSALSGAGYADAAMACASFAFDACVTATATALPDNMNPALPLAIEELDTPLRAGEVKLRLLEYYPAEYSVYLCVMDESGAYSQKTIPLFELDRQRAYHASTVLFVPSLQLLSRERFGYEDLAAITHRLRAPGGCPWDAEQTHESLKKNLIEECYEVLDAIDQNDDGALLEELGDVMLQCVFHAEIATEQGRFSGRDVSTAIVKKLIYRHPHIFADGAAKSTGDVLIKWEELKKTEKSQQTQGEVLMAVPKNLPALMRAYKVQKKAAHVGFDWPQAKDALFKLREECGELSEAMSANSNIEEEMGDVLFSAVNVCRLLGLEPEQTLHDACMKFMKRFIAMETLSLKKGKKLQDLSPEEQGKLWEFVKST